MKNSQQAATLRAMLSPPVAEIWMRMKSISRSAARKTHSLRWRLLGSHVSGCKGFTRDAQVCDFEFVSFSKGFVSIDWQNRLAGASMSGLVLSRAAALSFRRSRPSHMFLSRPARSGPGRAAAERTLDGEHRPARAKKATGGGAESQLRFRW